MQPWNWNSKYPRFVWREDELSTERWYIGRIINVTQSRQFKWYTMNITTNENNICVDGFSSSSSVSSLILLFIVTVRSLAGFIYACIMYNNNNNVWLVNVGLYTVHMIFDFKNEDNFDLLTVNIFRWYFNSQWEEREKHSITKKKVILCDRVFVKLF